MGHDVRVRRIDAGDVQEAAPLFARYRVFYGQPYNEPAATAFLRDRLSRQESVVLLAEQAGEPLGIAQLYPGFSSIAAAPAWVLGDLFVLEQARGQGVATALMRLAEQLARAAGAVYLALETAVDNVTAQRLYEREGYRVERGFLAYEKPLTGSS